MKEQRLEDLKQEFENIPLPEDLEFRVKASLQKAKAEQIAAQSANRWRRIWKNSFLTTAAAMLTIVVLANSSASVASAMERIPVLGAITRVFTFRTFEDSSGNTSAKVEVPQVEGGSQALNKAIEQYTNSIIAQYKADAAALNDFISAPDAPSSESAHYDLELNYTVATDNARLFSLRFDQLLVMASGNQSVKIYNMDKESGKLLVLSDLFQPGSDALARISDSIKTQMQAQMAADKSIYYWLDDEIAAWNFQSVTDENSFYVNGDGELVIVFNEGDVGPMSMGLCEFVIPAADLADIALPGYLAQK